VGGVVGECEAGDRGGLGVYIILFFEINKELKLR
jgi:hypothetical protein